MRFLNPLYLWALARALYAGVQFAREYGRMPIDDDEKVAFLKRKGIIA